MPRGRKQRGRRGELKRKHEIEELDDREAQQPKISSTDAETNRDYEANDFDNTLHPTNFLGLLDEREQEYFKSIDSVIEADQFSGDDEKGVFLANVFKEAHGKESKIACSQSCSRVMEKLIMLADAEQSANIFAKFEPHFLDLMQHRFASHCCETLLSRVSHFVDIDYQKSKEAPLDDHSFIALEAHILSIVDAIKAHVALLISDQFASHVIRMLIIVLSGSPQDGAANSNVPRKRMRKVAVTEWLEAEGQSSLFKAVPTSFTSALSGLVSTILTDFDPSAIRPLAVHPVACPVLQMLLHIEFEAEVGSVEEKAPLFYNLFPDDGWAEEGDNLPFARHLLYDAVGTRLLEVIVSKCPGRIFKKLYKALFYGQLNAIANNEVAVFVLVQVVKRASKNDLHQILDELHPHIESIIRHRRTIVITTLIERFRNREISVRPISDSFKDTFTKNLSQRLRELFEPLPERMNQSSDTSRSDTLEYVFRTHGSILAQEMLKSPDELRDLVNNALLSVTAAQSLQMAKDIPASRVMQAALTAQQQDRAFRRIFVSFFRPNIAELAQHPVGSRVVDALSVACEDIKYLKDQLASELLSKEQDLRQTVPGRAVMRNWKLDTLKRRPQEWVLNKEQQPAGKSKLDVARERHAKSVARQNKKQAKKT